VLADNDDAKNEDVVVVVVAKANAGGDKDDDGDSDGDEICNFCSLYCRS
jgi:hypothetical protein